MCRQIRYVWKTVKLAKISVCGLNCQIIYQKALDTTATDMYSYISININIYSYIYASFNNYSSGLNIIFFEPGQIVR